MTNQDKKELARLVKWEISRGLSMIETVKKLSGLGFKQNTVRAYYKVFKDSQ